MWEPKRLDEAKNWEIRERQQRTFLCLLLLSFGVFLGLVRYDAEQLSAIATAALAFVTVYTVVQNNRQMEYIRSQAEDMTTQTRSLRKQTMSMSKQTDQLQNQAESMQEELQFKRRPRISILEEEDDNGRIWTVFENIGEIPIEATLRLSISEYNEAEISGIMNEDLPYEELPDEVKVCHAGGQNSWQERYFFIQSRGINRKEFDIRGALKRELEARGIGDEFRRLFWLRIDIDLRSGFEEGEEYNLPPFLFKVKFRGRTPDGEMQEQTMFSQYSFREARQDKEMP